jgi:hypothetical protein
MRSRAPRGRGYPTVRYRNRIGRTRQGPTKSEANASADDTPNRARESVTNSMDGPQEFTDSIVHADEHFEHAFFPNPSFLLGITGCALRAVLLEVDD